MDEVSVFLQPLRAVLGSFHKMYLQNQFSINVKYENDNAISYFRYLSDVMTTV
jgi:hypothetical protein